VTAAADAAVDIAADAYVWGYPLVVMHRTCRAHGGVGLGMVRRDRLATPADRTVVAPNDDTLYASGWFDLRDGDLVVDVGPMEPDRYWSVMLLDAYTHVAYVSRRLHGSQGVRVRVTYDPGARPGGAGGPGAPGTPPPHAGAGAAPALAIGTPTVWVLARVLVDGPDDLERARAAQARIAVTQPGVVAPPSDRRPQPHGAGVVAPPIGSTEPGDSAVNRGPVAFYEALREAVAADPPAPWHPAPPVGMTSVLDDLPDAGVLAEAVARAGATIAASPGVDRRRNGWGTRVRGAAFGDDVAYRAAFARVSLAGHLPAENRSFSRACPAGTSGSLRFAPGGEPPVDGFWSLTVYGPGLFLVDNELDRYSVGDRTPGVRRSADGSLTLLVGPERPDADSAPNWLPAPEGPFVLVLRAYEGRAPVVDARWFPPDLTLAVPGRARVRPADAC
jgi:hypothetical protein